MSRLSKWLLVAVVVIAALPLFPLSAYYFMGDGFLHLFRLYEFDRVLHQGVLYPRWAPDFANGYGYPVFNYYTPLAFYLAETIHLLGVNLAHAIIATFVLLIAIAATGAYALGVELAREHTHAHTIGLLTAIAYVFFPYFVLEFYVRGAIAEALAAALLPWLVWSLHRTLTRTSIAAILFTAIFSALFVISHNLTVLLIAPFLSVFVVREMWQLDASARKSAFARTSGALSLGALLSAFYWLPMLLELPLVAVSRERRQVADMLKASLLSFTNLFQFSFPYQYQDDPYPLAFLPMLLCITIVVIAFFSRRKTRGTILLFGIAALLATILLLDVARDTWLGIPFLSTAQFAWRITVLINLGVAVVISLLPTLFKPSRWATLVYVSIAFALIGNGVGNVKAQPLDHPRDDLTLAQMTRFEVNTRALGFGSFAEYLPLSVKLFTDHIESPAQTEFPTIALERCSYPRCVFTITTRNPVEISLREFFFPGWQVTLDGQPATLTAKTVLGLLTIAVPSGEHRIAIEWGTTLPRQLGFIASGIGALLVLVLMLWRARESFGLGALLLALSFVALLPTSVALLAQPAPMQSVQVEVSSQVRLLGLTIASANWQDATWQVRDMPSALHLKLFWQIKNSVENKPFAWRVVDTNGRVWAQHEQLPRYGAGAPLAWIPNQIVEDAYDVPLGIIPHGNYFLEAAYPSDGTFARVSAITFARDIVNAPSSPNIAHPVDALIGERIRLLGYDAPTRARAGDTLPLALFWRAERSVFEDYTTFVHVLDDAGKLVAQGDGLTDGGFYPTLLWTPGKIVNDQRTIKLPRTLEPGLYRITTGLYHFGNAQRLPVVVDDDASPDDLVELGTIKVPVNASSQPRATLNAKLGEAIRLDGFDAEARVRAGQAFALTLHWQAITAPQKNYQVFVHVLDANGNVVAQQDNAPRQNHYQTRIWDAGERVPDPYTFTLNQPGTYRIITGMYDAQTGERLPAFDASGNEQPDRRIIVTPFEVTP